VLILAAKCARCRWKVKPKHLDMGNALEAGTSVQSWNPIKAVLPRLCSPLPAEDDWSDSLAVIVQMGIRAVELPFAWLDRLEQQCEAQELRDQLNLQGIRPALLDMAPGPPVALDELTARVLQALQCGQQISVQYVVLPSSLLAPVGRGAAPDALLSRVASFAALAEQHGITLLLENHVSGIASGRRLGEMVKRVARPGLRASFDPAACVTLKRHPFLTEFMIGPLKQQMRCLRLKDAVFEDGHEVPVNEGNAELKELVSALEARCYDGWYALSVFGGGSFAHALRRAHTAAVAMLGSL